MSTFTRNNTEISFKEDGLGQQNRAEDGGMIIALEQWKAGLDTAEMFADLPDGACQEPHWGYVLKGAVHLKYTDGSQEVVAAGDVFYWPAGHTGWVEEDTIFLDFSPEQEFKEVSEHIARVSDQSG
jgi:hypothetical protein